MTPPYLKSQDNGILLSLKVQPRASRNAIGEAMGNELKVKVTAPPVDSAANEALVRFLAEVLGCSRGTVQLVRGQTSRHKQVLIQGMTISEVEAKLKGE